VQTAEYRDIEAPVPSKKTKLSTSISSHIQEKEEKDEKEHEGKQPQNMPPEPRFLRDNFSSNNMCAQLAHSKRRAAPTLSPRSRVLLVIRPPTTTPSYNVPMFSKGGVSGGQGGRREGGDDTNRKNTLHSDASLAPCLRLGGGGGGIVAKKVIQKKKNARALFEGRRLKGHVKTRRAREEVLEETAMERDCMLDLVSFARLCTGVR